MSLFEFVTVMISMILALTLGQLLSGATFLLRSSGEVRWYAPHTLWVTTLGLSLVNHWWALWDFRDLYTRVTRHLRANIRDMAANAPGVRPGSLERRFDGSRTSYPEHQRSPHDRN